MVQTVAGEVVLPRGVVRSILDRADGVPLYIEACTRSVLETTAQQVAGGRRMSSALLKEPVVPPSLHDAIMERLDLLGAAKRIAQVASIFGRQFDFKGLLHIADRSKRSLAAGLQSLEAAGLLTRQRTPLGTVFNFKHAMIQEVAYGALLKETRTELHARAVAWLRQVDAGSGGSRLAVLGYHYSRAGMVADAVGAWLDAGKEALARSANREAIANLWEGLELVARLPRAEDRHQLELVLQAHLGMAYTAMVGWAGPQVDQPFSRALELCRSYGTAREKAIVLWGVTIAALVNSQL
jgi:predicted ATPase